MPEYKTTALLKRKRLRRYWLSFLAIFFVCSVLFAVYFWSSHEFVRVEKISIVGNKFIETDLIENIFEEKTTGRHFYLADKKNFLLIPRVEISREIKKEFSVNRVSLKTLGRNELEIKIVEHEPVAIWCGQETNENSCYFVNDKGLIFAPVTMVVFNDLINLLGEIDNEPIGNNYVGSNLFESFLYLERLLNRINISIDYISTEDYETFNLRTKSGPYLLISDRIDPVEVVNNLKTTLEQESIHEIQFGNLEYVDLRFSGRAYYKIR